MQENHSSTFDFVVSLRRPGRTAINIISQLLIAIFLMAFIFYAYRFGLRGQRLWLVLIPVMIVGLWAYGYVRAANPEFVVHYRVELLIAAMGWMLLPLAPYAWLIGWFYAGLAVLERIAKRPLQYRFTTLKLSTNDLPPKHYEWYEVGNVMIRDNLFTLDLNNNKLVQRELETPIDDETRNEFNRYCEKHLHFTAKDPEHGDT